MFVRSISIVVILFKGIGNAPELKQKKYKLAKTATFQNVLDFLRKMLRYKPDESLVPQMTSHISIYL